MLNSKESKERAWSRDCKHDVFRTSTNPDFGEMKTSDLSLRIWNKHTTHKLVHTTWLMISQAKCFFDSQNKQSSLRFRTIVVWCATVRCCCCCWGVLKNLRWTKLPKLLKTLECHSISLIRYILSLSHTKLRGRKNLTQKTTQKPKACKNKIKKIETNKHTHTLTQTECHTHANYTLSYTWDDALKQANSVKSKTNFTKALHSTALNTSDFTKPQSSIETWDPFFQRSKADAWWWNLLFI